VRPEHVHPGRRSGYVTIYVKQNKYGEVPLNNTAREALASDLAMLPLSGAAYVFPTRKPPRSSQVAGLLGERALI
jgi:hypothetical protein